MKLVQFEDGTYGVRRGWRVIGYRFLALKTTSGWWGMPIHVSQYCKGTKEQAQAAMARESLKHRVIK